MVVFSTLPSRTLHASTMLCCKLRTIAIVHLWSPVSVGNYRAAAQRLLLPTPFIYTATACCSDTVRWLLAALSACGKEVALIIGHLRAVQASKQFVVPSVSRLAWPFLPPGRRAYSYIFIRVSSHRAFLFLLTHIALTFMALTVFVGYGSLAFLMQKFLHTYVRSLQQQQHSLYSALNLLSLPPKTLPISHIFFYC